MNRDEIGVHVERALYAESMGRCMNPDCQTELFIGEGDIMERAHIDAYCKTKDNSFDNLVILCPSCHKKFDKLHLFTEEQIRQWKEIRRTELESFFGKKYASFEELCEVVMPILSENKSFYENYFLIDNKALWDKFEGRILINNKKLKLLFESNIQLFQSNPQKEYSNLHCIQQFIAHVNEFEATRGDEEKNRQVLFPTEINSIFGVAPVDDWLLPSTESLEALITVFKREGIYKKIVLGVEEPYISLLDGGEVKTLYLKDTPRLRQLYYSNNCFRRTKVRLESLNFAFTCLRVRGLKWTFTKPNNLREINVNGIKFIFVYEYCLSDATLLSMFPEENSIIVNLHNWNGESCISQKAHMRAKEMNVSLITTDEFRKYISEI